MQSPNRLVSQSLAFKVIPRVPFKGANPVVQSQKALSLVSASNQTASIYKLKEELESDAETRKVIE